MYNQIVKPQTLVLDSAPCNDGSGTFPKLPVSWEEYGSAKTKDGHDKPIVAILPFFLGSAHAAGHKAVKDNKRVGIGYWDALIGPGEVINTDTHRVISFEPVINDSFHPGAINPATKRPYGGTFPNFSLADVSQIQRLALKQLGVAHVDVLMGASMGSLQAWHFMAHDTSFVSRMVLIVPGGLQLSQKTRTLARQWVETLEHDPDWHGGDYSALPKDKQPKKALLQVLTDFWYRVQFPVDHSLLYDLDDMGWADIAVAHHALDANDARSIDTVLAALDDKQPKVKAYKQTVKTLCERTDHNVLLWQLRSVLTYMPTVALMKSDVFTRRTLKADDMVDIGYEASGVSDILMIATKADDLLDIESVDDVIGMAAFLGARISVLRLPPTFTHAAGLNTASPDSILVVKKRIGEFLKPPAKL
ncbi:MAG: alpha/beta fold hydrolase [Hydrogenophaga sp.]|uniref:alpha/beta fold hydrolase n=1 Tax=Hydrogenophaga sp. TaxID=1904254 RepID=UPI0026375E73|nr:alpha/beta fold hydrolase [Hydrogenophaga sp.]MCV0437904.1 alpha/beta fold hydrolase [Hydrogenophaga sp.]